MAKAATRVRKKAKKNVAEGIAHASACFKFRRTASKIVRYMSTIMKTTNEGELMDVRIIVPVTRAMEHDIKEFWHEKRFELESRGGAPAHTSWA